LLIRATLAWLVACRLPELHGEAMVQAMCKLRHHQTTDYLCSSTTMAVILQGMTLEQEDAQFEGAT